MMGVVDITALHALGRGELKLSSSLEADLAIPQGWHAVTVTRYGPCPPEFSSLDSFLCTPSVSFA
jgi:hypothetical protein